MNIKGYIRKIAIDRNDIRKTDFSYLYQTNSYRDAVQFANQNIGVSGVKALLDTLQNDYRQYDESIKYLISKETQNENRRYALWEKARIGEVIVGLLVAICFVLMMITQRGYSNIKFLIQIFASLGFVIGVVVEIVFIITEVIRKKQYQNHIQKMVQEINNINMEYLWRVDMIKKQIDNLYLASLDPAHREIVLMRRDGERQHQELLQLQQAYQKAQEDILLEQARAREAQEKLLAIEQEREKRYKQW